MNRVATGGFAASLILLVVSAGAGLSRSPQLVVFGPHASGQQIVARAAAVGGPQPGSTARIDIPEVGAARLHEVKLRRAPKAITAKAPSIGSVPVVRQTSQTQVVSPRTQQLVVLTSWEEPRVSRVVVQTPEGSFYLAPYAALPTQAGWLLVQL